MELSVNYTKTLAKVGLRVSNSPFSELNLFLHQIFPSISALLHKSIGFCYIEN